MNLSQKMNLAQKILSVLFPSYRTQKENSEQNSTNVPQISEEDFFKKLPAKIKNLIDTNNIQEITLNGVTYFTFYDLQDGNYLAADINLKIYSLVHDARPAMLPMDISLLQILTQIHNDEFDVEQHLNNRYYP